MVEDFPNTVFRVEQIGPWPDRVVIPVVQPKHTYSRAVVVLLRVLQVGLWVQLVWLLSGFRLGP